MGNCYSKKNIDQPRKVPKMERKRAARSGKSSSPKQASSVPKLTDLPSKKQPKLDLIKRDLAKLPISKASRTNILEMKKKYYFPVKFIETNLILNALMGIKELKFQKTDIIMYDMRDLEAFSDFHFCNSQHYDIGLWTDAYNEDFARVTQFKHVFMIGDDTLYSSSDFDHFIESLSKAKLKCNGLFFYNIDFKVIQDENLEGLLVQNGQKTKLEYYPSLIVENEHLC